MTQEFSRAASVLGRDQVNFAQQPNSAGADVLKIADRRGDNVQNSHLVRNQPWILNKYRLISSIKVVSCRFFSRQDNMNLEPATLNHYGISPRLCEVYQN